MTVDQNTSPYHATYPPYDPPVYEHSATSCPPPAAAQNPPSYDQYMQTVDNRHVGRPRQFRLISALPDILEVEEDEVDVICPDMISSTTPTVASSTRSVKSVAGTTLSLKDIVRHACLPSKIFNVILRLRAKRKVHTVLNDGTKTGLDLLES